MTEFEQMDESERLQFTEFKRNLNRQEIGRAHV